MSTRSFRAVRRLLTLGAAALLALTGTTAHAQSAPKPDAAAPIGMADPSTSVRAESAAKRLHLSACRVIPVSADLLPAGVLASGAHATLSLELLPNKFTTFTLEPYSLRSPDYSLVLSDDTGDHVVPAELVPAPTTYHASTALGDQIWASIYQGQVTAVVVLAENPTNPIYIQPEFETSASPFHAVYAASDVLPREGVCGNDHCIGCQQPVAASPGGFVPRGPGAICKYIRMNIDCDFPMYQQYGRDFGTVLRHTDAVMLMANQLFSTVSPTSLPRFTIVKDTIRTTDGSDPYNTIPVVGGDISTLLSRVATVWPAAAATRDLTHLFTGRTTTLINGNPGESVIGLGYLGVVCSSSNASLARNVFGDNIASAASTSTHEIGHNFNMNHDNSGDPYIMAPAIASPPNTAWSAASTASYNNSITIRPSCGVTAVTDVQPDGATTLKNRSVRIDVLANDGRSTVICPSTVTSFTLPLSTTTAGGTVAVSTGTGPGGRNEVLYTPPANVDNILDTFNYVAAGVTSPVSVDVALPRAPDGLTGGTPGLSGTWYNTWPNGTFGSYWLWETPPTDFSIYSTIGSSFAPTQLNYTSALPGSQRGLSAVITGYIRIPSSGYWTFTASATTTARILIGGETLVLAPASAGGTEVSGTRALAAGLHTLRVEYYYGPGTPRLVLSYASDTQTKVVIPTSAYFQTLGAPCRPDFNSSGAVTVQDIFDFLAAWFASDPRADFNGANGINIQDIFDFLAAWFAGCP